MPELAIEVRGLSWSYSESIEQALRGVSFNVYKNECVGIIGPTGAGKTTLLYCLNGLIPHSFPGKMSGAVFVMGSNTLLKKVGELATAVGTVFEDPEAQFVGLSVEEDIVFGLENLCLSQAEMTERLRWALKVVGMEGYEQRNAHLLSGGQKQRVAIASILALRPSILVLDEPTAELDPVGKDEVFGVLRFLKEKLGMTLVIVEHELEQLVKIADRLVILDKGNKVAEGVPKELLRDITSFNERGLKPLEVTQLAYMMRDARIFGETPLTEDEAAKSILESWPRDG